MDCELNIPDNKIAVLPESTRALFVAILTRALKDIFKPTYSDHEIYKRQALYWIKEDDSESFTSYINICNYLDIDVDNIRKRVSLEISRMEYGLPYRIKFKQGSR